MSVKFDFMRNNVWDDDLHLTARTTNALINNEIHTIRDLMLLSDEDIRSLRGFGQKAYDEVTSTLSELSPETLDALIDKRYDTQQTMPFVDVGQDILEVGLVTLGLSARTTNALLNSDIRTVGDLARLSYEELGSIQGLGAKGVNELFAHDVVGSALKSAESSNIQIKTQELHEFFTNELKYRQLQAIDAYYGLSGEVATLQIVGDELGVTRERARQIIKAALVKIKKTLQAELISPNPKDYLVYAAHALTSFGALPEISPVYPTEAIALMFSDMFPEEIAVFKHVKLEHYWIVDDKEKMERLLLRSLEALRLQVGPVLLNELAKSYELPRDILYDLTEVTISGELIVLNSNKRALGNDRVYEIGQLLDTTIRPMTVVELSKKLNLGESVIRSTLDRIPGVVNVGRSTYALEKYGYSNKKTADIIEELLAQEGQPVHIDKILDYVKKYRVVKDGAVHGAIFTESDVFARLDDGYVALTHWGYDSIEPKSKRLEVSALEAVTTVLEKSQEPLSQGDILDRIALLYGDQSTKSQVTVAAILKKLIAEDLVVRLGTSRSPFYIKKQK